MSPFRLGAVGVAEAGTTSTATARQHAHAYSDFIQALSLPRTDRSRLSHCHPIVVGSSLRLPRLAAGVPADEAEVGDLRRDLPEALPLDGAVYGQLRDAPAL